MEQQKFNNKRRILEIELELARRKAEFFNTGIEYPMKERAALEHELAALKLAKYNSEELDRARKARVRSLIGEMMKQRLAELGLSNLHPECKAAAEAEIPPVEHSEVNHG